jgi:hypothetical protein
MKRAIILTLLTAALLLVLGGIAAVIFFAARGNGDFFRGGTQPFATIEESKTVKVDVKNPLTLKVIDDAGAVTVVGADVKTVEVKVVKTAHDRTQNGAEKEVKTIKYKIEQSGNTLTISYKLPKTTVFDVGLDTVDFTVTVPIETSVDIDSNLGDVGVSSIKGDAVILNDFGQVKVDNIEGAVSASSNSGEVSATSIKAGGETIELNSDFGAVSLRNASGSNITLDSNSGTITLREVRATGASTPRQTSATLPSRMAPRTHLAWKPTAAP